MKTPEWSKPILGLLAIPVILILSPLLVLYWLGVVMWHWIFESPKIDYPVYRGDWSFKKNNDRE